jgi:Zn-dependent protease
MFWLVGAIMGYQEGNAHGVTYLLLWIGCVFVSILVHEFGHIFMGRVFHSHGHIVLYAFGGLAIGSNQLSRRGQRIAVSFAGPLAGFLLLGVLALILYLADVDRFWGFFAEVQLQLGIKPAREIIPQWIMLHENFTPSTAVLDYLIFINLMWGLLNLLPIWPLDGGQISREVCEGLAPGKGLRFSLGISFLLAALLAVHSLMAYNKMPLLPFLPVGGLFSAILFGLLAIESFQLLQQVKTQPRYQDEDAYDPWERDRDEWRR